MFICKKDFNSLFMKTKKNKTKQKPLTFPRQMEGEKIQIQKLTSLLKTDVPPLLLGPSQTWSTTHKRYLSSLEYMHSIQERLVEIISLRSFQSSVRKLQKWLNISQAPCGKVAVLFPEILATSQISECRVCDSFTFESPAPITRLERKGNVINLCYTEGNTSQ